MKHIRTLTGLRGIAALWVAWFHSNTIFPINQIDWGITNPLRSKGWLGVDLFFVLSGFVLSYVYQVKLAKWNFREAITFWKLRFFRIYPAHITVMIALLVLYVIATYGLHFELTPDQYTLSKFLYGITLLNGWGIPDSLGWNIPSWSVSAEWFAYLCFPLFAPRLLQVRSLIANLICIVAVFVAMIVATYWLTQGKQFILPWEFTLLRVTSEFAVGCFIFNISRLLVPQLRFDWLALLCLVSIIVLAGSGASAFWDWIYVALFAALILALCLSQGFVNRLLGSTFPVHLGEVSYSLYLVHVPILMLMNQLGKRAFENPSMGISWGVFIMYFIATYACAAIMYYCIESPVRTYAKTHWVENDLLNPPDMTAHKSITTL